MNHQALLIMWLLIHQKKFHNLVFCTLELFQKANDFVEIRNMKHFNEAKFVNELLNQQWENGYFFGDDPNAMWRIWEELFLEVLNKHAPLQHKKTKSSKVPWITNKVKCLITTRNKLKRKAITTKTETDRSNYKKIKNQVNVDLRNAKKNYYSSKIANQKQNPKKAWKSINELLGKQNKKSKVNEIKPGESILNNPTDIAEGFNNYFSDIGPDLASQIQTSTSNFETHVKIATLEFAAFQHTTVDNVYQLLSRISSNKATGIDKISCKMIRMAAPAIADSLTNIFNQAITLASFPDEWKIARVIPLFKSGHRNMPGNYRPISILPAISKIMERILTEYGLLSSAQFGFRESHSTATALLNCTNEWYMNIDKKMFNLVVFIDLKKAFDTVNHGILVKN